MITIKTTTIECSTIEEAIQVAKELGISSSETSSPVKLAKIPKGKIPKDAAEAATPMDGRLLSGTYSFLETMAPGDFRTLSGAKYTASRLSAALGRYRRLNPGVQFSYRTLPSGKLRVTRVE